MALPSGATTGSTTGLQGLAAPQFNALGVQDRLVTVGPNALGMRNDARQILAVQKG